MASVLQGTARWVVGGYPQRSDRVWRSLWWSNANRTRSDGRTRRPVNGDGINFRAGRRYTAGKVAMQVRFIRRFLPESFVDKTLRKFNKLPA